MSAVHLYKNHKVAFLTQHGKQTLLRGPLESALGCELVHTDGYDTDLLGTFTRDKTRPCSQFDAAKKKALIGMSLTGTSIAIASEGSFGMDPYSGFIPWNTEVVVWIDQNLGIDTLACKPTTTAGIRSANLIFLSERISTLSAYSSAVLM